MFNCYIVYLDSKQIAIFKTEIAALNFIDAMGWQNSQFKIEGKYIPDIGF